MVHQLNIILLFLLFFTLAIESSAYYSNSLNIDYENASQHIQALDKFVHDRTAKTINRIDDLENFASEVAGMLFHANPEYFEGEKSGYGFRESDDSEDDRAILNKAVSMAAFLGCYYDAMHDFATLDVVKKFGLADVAGETVEHVGVVLKLMQLVAEEKFIISDSKFDIDVDDEVIEMYASSMQEGKNLFTSMIYDKYINKGISENSKRSKPVMANLLEGNDNIDGAKYFFIPSNITAETVQKINNAAPDGKKISVKVAYQKGHNTKDSEEISMLTNVRYLDFRKNYLKEVPSYISKMKDLELLNMEYNQIKEVPEFLANMDELREIKLAANTLNKRLPRKMMNNYKQTVSGVYELGKIEKISETMYRAEVKDNISTFYLFMEKDKIKNMVDPFFIRNALLDASRRKDTGILGHLRNSESMTSKSKVLHLGFIDAIGGFRVNTCNKGSGYDVWVTYASPIKDLYKERIIKFDNIEMICSVSVEKDYPIACHRGICKNLDYLAKCENNLSDKKYVNHKGISMLMHSFAAKCVLSKLRYPVEYMETDALRSMKKIFDFYDFKSFGQNIIKYDADKAPASRKKFSGENIKVLNTKGVEIYCGKSKKFTNFRNAPAGELSDISYQQLANLY